MRSGGGERLVAWSAIGVLAIAGAYMIERVGRLPAALDDGRTVVVVAPAADAAKIPAALTRVPRPAADDALPAARTPDATLDAARRATRPASQSTRKAKARNVPRAATPPPPPSGEAALPPASPRVEQVVVAAAPARPARTQWDSMHEELAACPSADFIEDVMCQQRIRIRYCVGWWGQVGECPSRQGSYGG